MCATTVLLPGCSVTVPTECSDAAHGLGVGTTYVKCDVTSTPFTVICSVVPLRPKSSHQSMVMVCDAVPNVPLDGVMVTMGGLSPGPHEMHPPCGEAAGVAGLALPAESAVESVVCARAAVERSIAPNALSPTRTPRTRAMCRA